MGKTAAALFLLALPSTLPASAAEHNSVDPYEPYNRFVFNINNKADHYVLVPVVCGYRKVTLKPVCAGVSNFFNNLRDVISFGSNVLRLDAKCVNEDFTRVDTNTTLGLGGLTDVAGAGGIPNNKNMLGDTLASWGWKNSNYFVVPLFGPSIVRDTTGSIITTIYPVKNAVFHTSAGHWSTTELNAVNSREGLSNLTDGLEGVAPDRYSYIHSLYIRVHTRQIGGTLPQTPDDNINTDKLVDSGKPDSLSPTETADTPQTASAPVIKE